jgi:dTDP-4-dehydrorhamnose 3,5-epimerase
MEELSSENKFTNLVLPGYAHNFLTPSDEACFLYKFTNFYNSLDETGMIWNDPDLNIDWPISNPILSSKDSELR